MTFLKKSNLILVFSIAVLSFQASAQDFIVTDPSACGPFHTAEPLPDGNYLCVRIQPEELEPEEVEEILEQIESENGTSAVIFQSIQINRQTNNAISSHLMKLISRSFISLDEEEEEDDDEEEEEENKIGASSDGTSPKDLSTWGDASFANLQDDDKIVSFDTNIYQIVGGVDKSFGDLIVGSAITYAYTNNTQFFQDYTSNNVGITPYLAYKLNDYFFLSGLLGYTYSGINGQSRQPDSDLNAFTTEGNLNAFNTIDSFILKGRIGVRYNYTDTSIDNGRSGSSNSITAIADAEVGYMITEEFSVFAGTQYEYVDRSSDGINAIRDTSAYRDGVFYFRSGLDYSINQDLHIGAVIETDLNDDDKNLLRGGLNLSLSI